MNYKIEHLPTALLSLRLLAEMTSEAVAEHTASHGLEVGKVKQWENGEVVPSYEELVTLLGVYERTFIDLEIMLEVSEDVEQFVDVGQSARETSLALNDVEKVLRQYVKAGPESPEGRWFFEVLKTLMLMAQIEVSKPLSVVQLKRTQFWLGGMGKDGNV